MTPTATIYGWDLGGAHLKRVGMDASGRLTEAIQVPCTLWRGVEHLRAALEGVSDPARERGAVHAVTMTGELCDNFLSREAGVAAITATTVKVLGAAATRIFAGASGWLEPDRVNGASGRACASANWYAMAVTVAAHLDHAVLVDIGSTTTDIVPISNGAVACRGHDDGSRLQHEELVYTGVVRTPLMSIAKTAPYDGSIQGVASEYFANMGDVYRLRAELPRDADLHETADGEDRSEVASARRIMRMFGRDGSDDLADARRAADYFAHCQFDQLQRALLRVMSGMTPTCGTLVGAGAGHFLAERLAAYNGLNTIDFSSLFELAGADPHLVSTCAPAAAVAALRRATL